MEDHDTLDAPASLDHEKAIVFAAMAARTWTQSKETGTEAESISGRELLSSLMRATTWVCRARAHHHATPLRNHELVDSFTQPLREWLPGGPDMALLDESGPTPLCLELAEEAGASPTAEIEQRVILRAMNHVAFDADAATRYTAFRRFLVENPTTTEAEAARAARSVGVTLADLYGTIPINARITANDRGGNGFFPCPRCRWPMRIFRDVVTCAYSESCLAAGARYRLRDEGLLPLGSLPAPAAMNCTGMAALRPGVWRFTTLPGIEEVSLEKRLLGLSDVQVDLWPFVDRYDLHVRKHDLHWRIDVKDRVSVMKLAQYLSEHPTSELIWIVVPDARRDQVRFLERRVPSSCGYHFAHSSALVRHVGGEA